MLLHECRAFAAALGPEGWSQVWGSIHEAAHCCVARHFGWPITIATLDVVTVPHPHYESFGCPRSFERLTISAAGDCATTQFLGYELTGTQDDRNARERLRILGATETQADLLMSLAHRAAESLVIELRPQIEQVAQALIERRALTQQDIDAAITGGNYSASRHA